MKQLIESVCSMANDQEKEKAEKEKKKVVVNEVCTHILTCIDIISV